jgi:hypothetical protein
MNPLFIALNALDQSNVEKLYQFELKNRIFFEKTIAT